MRSKRPLPKTGSDQVMDSIVKTLGHCAEKHTDSLNQRGNWICGLPPFRAAGARQLCRACEEGCSQQPDVCTGSLALSPGAAQVCDQSDRLGVEHDQLPQTHVRKVQAARGRGGALVVEAIGPVGKRDRRHLSERHHGGVKARQQECGGEGDRHPQRPMSIPPLCFLPSWSSAALKPLARVCAFPLPQ